LISFDREPICDSCLAPLATREWMRAAQDGEPPVLCDDCLVDCETAEPDWDSFLSSLGAA
jgi:hypothetical protein